MKGVVLEKFPPLKREGFSYSSPSPFRLQEGKERKGAGMKDCEQDSFISNNWPDPVQRRHNSATAWRKIHSEEKQNVSLGKQAEMDTVIPPKPGFHQIAFNQSKCQANGDYVLQKDEKSIDCHCHWESDKRVSNRRQETHKNMLGFFVTDSTDLYGERGEANGKSLNGYQKGQRRLYEDEIRLTMEIHKKEMLLKEKLEKTAETLRKIQLRSGTGDKVKSEEQRNRGKAENRLYYTEKGNWDWESARDRALGGRRHEGPREEFDNWDRGKDGIGKQQSHVKGTNAGQKKKRREGIECENRGRNTQRTTDTVEEEYDHFEEMSTRERVRSEKDKTRRERGMEQQGNDLGDWVQRDWKKREIVRGNDGEIRRPGGANLKRDVGNEDQQWDRMDKFASTSQMKVKAVSKHDKTSVLTEEHLESQEGRHQYSNKTEEEMPLKKPQVLPNPESSPDTNVQLVPCEVCNKYFKEDRLEKHFRICLKTRTENKRKVYNSSYYRAKGTQLEEFLKSDGQHKSPEPKKSNWRQKHEDLVSNIRQARAPAPGGFQPNGDLYSDYITCPHCTRRFAPGPAENHIPKCQYIKSIPRPPRRR